MSLDLNDPIMDGYVPIEEIIEDEGGEADGLVAEKLQLSTAVLAFSTTGEGYESETMPIVMTNVGYDTVNIYGDPIIQGDFILKSEVPGSLLAGESATVLVAFVPTSIGAKTGSIYFNTGNAAGDELVSLTGTGIVAAPEVPPEELAEMITDTVAAAFTNVSDLGSAPYATASINALGILSVPNHSNLISTFPNGNLVTGITWTGGSARPRDVLVRNASATESIIVTLSNNVRSSMFGTTGTITIPPLGALVMTSFAAGFWIITSSHLLNGVAEEVTGFGGVDVLLRNYLADPLKANPTAAEWQAAAQAAHDDVAGGPGEAKLGTVWFSEPIQLTGPLNWHGYVSMKGIAYGCSHRFAKPEPYMGAMLLAPAGDMGDNNFGGTTGLVANGVINVYTDTTHMPDSVSRPRLNIAFENFGIYGSATTKGTGIRVAGSMYVNIRNVSIMWMPSWGIYFAGRNDISPGSSNGGRLEDVLVTSCGTTGVLDSSGGIYWGSPDSHLENIQVGGCLGLGIVFQTGNVSGEQIQSWNNHGDNVRVSGSFYVDLHVLAYDGERTNVAILNGSNNITIRGQGWNPNHRAETDARISSNVYVDDDCYDITIDMALDGETDRYGWSTGTAWTAGETLHSDGTTIRRVNEFKLYTFVPIHSLIYKAQSANFVVGGTVVGGTSGARGVIVSQSDSGTTGTLTLRNVTGTFVDNEPLTGTTGGVAVANGTQAQVNPTTATDAPTHTSGIVADGGGAYWSFMHGFGRYGVYDDAPATFQGRLTIKQQPVNHTAYDVVTQRTNVAGDFTHSTGIPSAGSYAVFKAGDANGSWTIFAKRKNSTDAVKATILGHATDPVIFDKQITVGSTIDLEVSSGYVRVTSTYPAIATVEMTRKRLN